MPMPKKGDLTVAVTGPTGTFGFGLMPLLQADPRIAHVVGIARRPFDPAEHGWNKMEYRRGDVRDPAALEEAFAGCRRRGPPRVPDHRHRSARHHPRHQRRGHAERVPRRGRGRRQALRLRLVGRGVRLPPRQPGRHDRGLAGPARRAPLLRAGEGRDSSSSWTRRPTAPGARALPAAPARSCSVRTRSAPRSCCPARSRRSARGLARLVSGCPSACRHRRPTLPVQFIHEDDVGQALAAVHRRRGPARRLQHRRRRRAHGRRDRA